MKGPLAPVQRAVIAKLKEQMPSRTVWAEVPDDAALPYLVYLGTGGEREPNKGVNLWVLVVEIGAYYREPGAALHEAAELIDEAIEALTGQDIHGQQSQALEIDGFAVVGLQAFNVDPPERNPETGDARIVARFRLRIQEI